METNDWNDAERHVERAQELFEQRKLDEALVELRAATSINPFNAGWFYNLGLTLDELGRFDEAVGAYHKALAIEPDDVASLGRLAADLHALGKFQAAIETYERIGAIDPACEGAYCGRILSYSDLGDHDRAEEMFYTARLYKEHCPQCYYNIGVSLAARGSHDKAIFCWQRTLDHQGDHPQVHVRIAESLWAKGDHEQARQHYLTGLRNDPGNVELLLDLSDLLVEMKRFDEAGEKIRRSIELMPESPAAHYCHGRWLIGRGKIDDAAGALVHTLEVDPTYPGAHLRLAEIHHRRREIDAARKHLRAEMLLRPVDPKTLMDLSNLLVDVAESRQAVACLKRLVNIEPHNVSAWQNLAVAQFTRRRYFEGIASCQAALRLQPNSPQVLYNLALAYGHMHQFDLALSHVRRGLDFTPRDLALQKLELRLRLLRLKARVTDFFRGIVGGD